jgi:hypothetical protein
MVSLKMIGGFTHAIFVEAHVAGIMSYTCFVAALIYAEITCSQPVNFQVSLKTYFEPNKVNFSGRIRARHS